ncbi:nucleotidyl transferase AbiEii/AbiGii toxin family protein [Chlorobium sp. KB01]|uniref:nucleotidyl transferase AbiEii/AbiGii toxin family protein n=1 Tax=Chlorobium sp. KB01 TaxID=1917528 RepID=UPI001E52C357|nr:nucleotidyl transferase AbiEii/AbiGii toxin family protein [Chlorobium sp. KB01]
MEKVIYALSLVEQLAQTDLSFTFKGGTSLLLILPEPKRFSIDVDIVTTESREKIEAVLTGICSGGIFSKFELDERRSYNPGIPKAHYKLTFFSQSDNKELWILLDILFEEHGYTALVQAPIINEWIQTDDKLVTVQIPSADSITGDKLTAFAPNTVGIRFRVEDADGGITEKQMEVMKQLFDIGILFDRISNLDHLKQSFTTTAQKEISYRGEANITTESVLNDIITTSLMIGSQGKFFDPNQEFQHIAKGLTQLKSYIYNGSFRIDDAVLASAKAAYLAAMILTGYEGEIIRWAEGNDIMNYSITPIEYQFLNKRRNIPGAPLFYWYQTLSLLGKL